MPTDGIDDSGLGLLGVCTRPGCVNVSWAGCICYACSKLRPPPACESIGGPEVDPPDEYRRDRGQRPRGKLRGGT